MCQKTRLGAAVTALLHATYDDSDYSVEPECNSRIMVSQARDYDRVARSFGFRDRHHLAREVERRTSSRWVYFNLPIAGPIED